MSPLSNRNQLLVGLTLVLAMAVTRVNCTGVAGGLPDASWALFFLAGFYLRPGWAFWALMAEAVAVDFAAVTWGGVDAFCLTPAYALLLPAHGALWLAGRWYAGHYRGAWTSLLALAGSAFAGTALAELIASGGFYLFSGRFADLTLAGLAGRLVDYFPASLEAMGFYLAIAALVHVAFAAITRMPSARAV